MYMFVGVCVHRLHMYDMLYNAYMYIQYKCTVYTTHTRTCTSYNVHVNVYTTCTVYMH